MVLPRRFRASGTKPSQRKLTVEESAHLEELLGQGSGAGGSERPDVTNTASYNCSLSFFVWLTLLPGTLGPNKHWPHGVLIDSRFPIPPVSFEHLAVM